MNKRYYLGGAVATVAISCIGVLLHAGASGGDLSKQQPKYHIDYIPPAPVLSPQDELKTFKLPPGFRIELVASEPMVEEPVCLTFDPDGGMYVVEMRGYMPDLAGTTEMEPVGRVSHLESTKGDDVYDKTTVFLDKLVIPRSVGLAGDGVLVAEPPTVWFCRDTKGTGQCDDKKPIFTDYSQLKPADPEHKANGLTWVLDNWYYNANWSYRFRYEKGQFLRDGTISRGQWGITNDDTGRIFYNSNSSMLRVDEVPAQYLTRNPYLSNPAGLNVGIASNAVFSARVNPGCNRGYQEDCNLKGYLQRVTAACGPAIYRSEEFPAEYRGNAFIAEPAGNLVSRQVLEPQGINILAKSMQHDGIDFLCSTDERFRPVSLYTGPDGALYLIDMYHGIIQHKAYISAYLADQVKKRDLEENNGHKGRIWRIVPDNFKPARWPKLSTASSADLVKEFSNPNGWWRDTAQRLLVERNDPKMVKPLAKLVTNADSTPLAKLHALWTLQGMDKLEDEVTAAAAKDPDSRVRLAALEVAEVSLRKHVAPRTQKVMLAMVNDPDPHVQLQVLTMASPDLPDVEAAALGVLAAHLRDPVFRSVAINASTGRELEMLRTLISNAAFTDEALAQAQAYHPTMEEEKPPAPEPDPAKPDPKADPIPKPQLPALSKANGKEALFHELSTCIVRSRSNDRIEALLDLIAEQPTNSKSAQVILAGAADALAPDKKSKVVARRLRLTREPPSLAKLLASSDKKTVELATKVEGVMSWPGKPGDHTPPLKPLSSEQAERFATGREIFSQICAQCHQPSGLGQDGIAPPLVDSEWVLGPQDRVVRIVLNGLHGPIKAGRKTVDLEMPGLKAMDDNQLSSVLTYIRREWGHEGSPIDPPTIAEIRKATDDRGDLQWTAEELMAVK